MPLFLPLPFRRCFCFFRCHFILRRREDACFFFFFFFAIRLFPTLLPMPAAFAASFAATAYLPPPCLLLLPLLSYLLSAFTIR